VALLLQRVTALAMAMATTINGKRQNYYDYAYCCRFEKRVNCWILVRKSAVLIAS
jgi:hypothetical protein